ncbi:MAG: MmcQ/YjbR family DNA-binding protein [Daejeonella sp.]
MIDLKTCRDIALSFPETVEAPHFGKTSFRVAKKIFATMNIQENRICIKLSEVDQDVFSAFDRTIIYPVPNKWGKQGWTLVDLTRVREDMLTDMLTSGYCEVAPKRLGESVKRFN